MNIVSEKQPNTSKKHVGSQVKSDVPQVSVIIPAYNIAEFISATLDSALAQTFEDFEIIVINDGSPDTEKLEKILEKYFDEIIYIKQKNGGAALARNTGILESRGKILAFLDGDDIWFPEKLASQVKFLENNDFDMVYCNALLFGETVHNSQTFMDKSPSSGKVTPENLLNGTCNIITSGNIVRKDLVIKHGLFDEKAFRVEDFDLWFRLCKRGVKIGYQKNVMLKYRIREGSLTGDNIEKAQRTIDALQTVKNKNEFTDSEFRAWEIKLRDSIAELNSEKGKDNLIKGNFTEAQKNFSEAVSYRKNFKLVLLNFLIKFSPKLVLALFRKLRPNEFSYIAGGKSQNNSV